MNISKEESIFSTFCLKRRGGDSEDKRRREFRKRIGWGVGWERWGGGREGKVRGKIIKSREERYGNNSHGHGMRREK